MARYQKFLNWTVSPSGQSTAFGFAVATSITAFCSYVVPNTFCLYYYKNLVQSYRKGLAVSLPAYLTERFQKTIELLEIPGDEKQLLKPFSVVGFELFNAGSTYSRFGSIIGLPTNFFYTDVNSIDKYSIKLRGESILWDTDAAKDFLNALIMSEKAQMYGIAREIMMTRKPKFLFDTMNATFWVSFTYFGTTHLNRKLNLFPKPFFIRLILYGIISAFSLVNFFMVSDFNQLYYEQQIDKELKDKSPIFVEGALEYYSQILKRNVALRKLLGKEGESTFSPLGNENYLLRQKHMPLIQRKSFFEAA